MKQRVTNFTVLDSVYGRFIVNRHCLFQAEALVKTGRTHIEAELNTMRKIIKTLPEGCVIVDGGANIGFVTVPLAIEIKAKSGVVLSFEPQRMLFNALSGTLALNELDNVMLTQKALGAKAGVTRLPPINYSQKIDFGQISLNDAQTGEIVEIIPIDNLKLPRLDFLKLDIEGYEIDALIGAKKTIAAFEPWCWVEFWKTGAEKIEACFNDLDYSFYKMDDLNLLCAPISRLKSSGLKLTKANK